MKRFFGSLKGRGSQRRPNQNREQWASSGSYAGPSQSVWEDEESNDLPPPSYASLGSAPSSAGPSDSKAPSNPYDSKAPANPFDSPDDLIAEPQVPEHLQKYSNGEDPFAFLSHFDTVFLIDDSGSMEGKSWNEAADVLRAITPICTFHDKDGIDLYFLNHRSSKKQPEGKGQYGYYNIETPEEITEIFKTVQPNNGTPTGARLRTILRPYVLGLPTPKDKFRNIDDVKPINIIVITDGAPSDDPDAVIRKYAKDLDELDAPVHQVGIQFFQVGSLPGAAEALQHLDDLFGSSSDVRDMVDTVSWDANPSRRFRPRTLSADTILKVVLGAVIRRLDKLPAVKKS
ncbi:uncharacterized protein Triagg1_6563 [Trichoderma aggressivum f. europaeum]|uniref:VWFA domain-containing protein n=1 Tax=Trichoderma aggressivum f. europaeum TaxID=173218 RepID=A0AAE1J413_9HYPO|nr:hypothetical protein Triagg1_6563 [Trichoderma aggressivum f. europaeum]